MAYKALYRTYRPQTFSDVVGQKVVVQTLKNAILNKKISHAYLFCGPRGTGKTTVARLFAKALCCTSKDTLEPCNNCDNCREISEGINPDVIEIDAASNNGVDEIRDIREKVKFLPSGSQYKIYIIDEVHMLSGGAFNALLKTLEEPPKHVIFILATTEPQKLPATIISRCQRFEFKSLSNEEINFQLRKVCDSENIEATEEALNSISESADGAMRDALSILDQAISYGTKELTIEDINGITGTLNFETVIKLAQSIEKRDVHITIETINELISYGKEAGRIVNGLIIFYRDVLLYKSIKDTSFTKYIFTKEKFQDYASKASVAKTLHFIDILSDAQNKVKSSFTPNVYLEIALIKMCNTSSEELDTLKRISDMENKLNNIEIPEYQAPVANSLDNEKITSLEMRVNQVVSELNNLELDKLAIKVEKLITESASKTLGENKSDDFKEDLQDLKQQVIHLEDDIDNIKHNSMVEENSIDLSKVLNRLDLLEKSKIVSAPVNLDNIYKRLEKIEQAQNQNINLPNDSINLDNIYERLEKIEQMRNQNIDSSSGSINLDNIYERLEKIEQRNAIENPSDVDLTDVYSRIKNLEEKQDEALEKQDDIYNEHLESVINEEIKNIKDDVDNIKLKITNVSNTNYTEQKQNIDFSEIVEKIASLERKVYQILSGEIANQKEKTKITRKHMDQIMFFGDEVLSFNEYSKKEAKGRFDFEDLQEIKAPTVEKKESALDSKPEENKQSIKPDEIKQVINNTEDKPVSEIKVYTENYSSDELPNKPAVNVREEISKEVTTNASLEQKESLANEESLFKVKQEENTLFSKPTTPQKPVRETIRYYDEVKGEEIVNKEHSSLAIRDKKNTDNYTLEKDLIAHEAQTEHKLFSNKNEEINKVVETRSDAVRQAQTNSVDKFASYNIKYIEQILHDSCSIEARNDKIRIEQLWKIMSRGASPELFGIVDTLQEGRVVVVGNKELIISFPNVTLCNQVMRTKFKVVALKILYNLLGDTYNYVALPNDVWLEKRNEYKEQYQIGTKYPTLTPITKEGLEIISIEEEYKSDKEKAINKTITMFGKNIVEIIE